MRSIEHLVIQEPSPSLNVNNVFLSFPQYLWTTAFIAPSSSLLAAGGIAKLSIRACLQRLGMLEPLECDTPVVIASIALGTVEVTKFVSISREEHIDKNGVKTTHTIGHWHWNKLRIIAKTTTEVIEELDIYIDLNTSRWVRSTATGYSDLTAKDTLVLILFDNCSASHVKLHAYANWGVDPQHTDSFIRKCAVSTVIYNYYGLEMFPKIMASLYYFGVITADLRLEIDVLQEGVDAGMPEHSHLDELHAFSPLVRFIRKARAVFMREFVKHRDQYFQGVDGEALFVGTVLHSIDHAEYARLFSDPLWAQADHPRLAGAAELVRVVRAGFADDLPLLSFSMKFKDATHPFFRDVYEKTKLIDARYADAMDCCIIR